MIGASGGEPPTTLRQMTEFHVNLRNADQPWERSILARFVGSTAERDSYRYAVEFCGGPANCSISEAVKFLEAAKPFENATVDITCAQTV
tara:strand:+ start:6298 stop:6567 length:270 start_codon:yes stop_codon:yes gene_type:complete